MRIPITIYEEIKLSWGSEASRDYEIHVFPDLLPNQEIKWIEGVPYRVSVVN